MPIELNVKVERVAYPKPTTETDGGEAWYILITDQGACKGKMLWRPADMETLTLDGEWAAYKGEREFKFTSARLNVPTNPREQLHYVCERTHGIGPAMEEEIWAKCGENWRLIRDGEVQRMSGARLAEFYVQIEGLESKSEEARTISALMGKGATMNMAAAAWAKWGDKTLGVVNSNCYHLAELSNYGFRDVDAKVRVSYGIGDDDKRRIRAAVVYALRRLTDGGDTVVFWADLFRQAVGMLGGYDGLVSECTSELFDDGSLKAFKDSEGVSLTADFVAECAIWEFTEMTKG